MYLPRRRVEAGNVQTAAATQAPSRRPRRPRAPPDCRGRTPGTPCAQPRRRPGRALSPCFRAVVSGVSELVGSRDGREHGASMATTSPTRSPPRPWCHRSLGLGLSHPLLRQTRLPEASTWSSGPVSPSFRGSSSKDFGGRRDGPGSALTPDPTVRSHVYPRARVSSVIREACGRLAVLSWPRRRGRVARVGRRSEAFQCGAWCVMSPKRGGRGCGTGAEALSK